MAEWTRETYEASVSSRSWWFTPYGGGWDASAQLGADLREDDELRAIVEMERALPAVPAWAERVVDCLPHLPPPCGHYRFPRSCLEAVVMIGSETAPAFVHGCYTADAARKERALDYVFLLDAWRGGATAKAAALELRARGRTGPDWPEVAAALWKVLGPHTELKERLVDRTVHRYRWWAKALAWDDDARDRFCTADYLGDIRGSGDSYGNPGFRDPYYTERHAPRVKRTLARLNVLNPGWRVIGRMIDDTWLCGPKSFRFLERILWCIGHERGLRTNERVPDFLAASETWPAKREAARWWKDLLVALDGWWYGKAAMGPVADDIETRLGRRTDVKRWLVRLYAHRLRLLAEFAPLGKLVDASRTQQTSRD